MSSIKKIHFLDGEEVWTYKVGWDNTDIRDPNRKRSVVPHAIMDPGTAEYLAADWDPYDSGGMECGGSGYTIVPYMVKSYIEENLRANFLKEPKKKRKR